jgi:hypothetical protein
MGLTSSLRWLNASDLMSRWEISNIELANLILNHGLPPCNPDLQPIDIIKVKKELDEHYHDYDEYKEIVPKVTIDTDFILERLEKYWFNLLDIEIFEKENSRVQNTNEQLVENDKKLRPNQRHRERCRAIAELLWKMNPEITIADMAHKDEINGIACENRIPPYSEDTIRDWINDLSPNRKPGRRPTKK